MAKYKVTEKGKEKLGAYFGILEEPNYIKELEVDGEKMKTKVLLIYDNKEETVEVDTEIFARVEKYNFIEKYD